MKNCPRVSSLVCLEKETGKRIAAFTSSNVSSKAAAAGGNKWCHFWGHYINCRKKWTGWLGMIPGRQMRRLTGMETLLVTLIPAAGAFADGRNCRSRGSPFSMLIARGVSTEKWDPLCLLSSPPLDTNCFITTFRGSVSAVTIYIRI